MDKKDKKKVNDKRQTKKKKKMTRRRSLFYVASRQTPQIFSHLSVNTPHTSASSPSSCVKSCGAYRSWGPSSDRAAPTPAGRGKGWIKVSFSPPWFSRRTHRRHWHHDRGESAESLRPDSRRLAPAPERILKFLFQTRLLSALHHSSDSQRVNGQGN